MTPPVVLLGAAELEQLLDPRALLAELRHALIAWTRTRRAACVRTVGSRHPWLTR